MHVATVFVRSCGATTGFSTHVSVLGPNQVPSGGGNIFVADGDHGRVKLGSRGELPLRIHWLDDTVLTIAYRSRARVLESKNFVQSVRIRFETDSSTGEAGY
jgi:hypothetical protein